LKDPSHGFELKDHDTVHCLKDPSHDFKLRDHHKVHCLNDPSHDCELRYHHTAYYLKDRSHDCFNINNQICCYTDQSRIDSFQDEVGRARIPDQTSAATSMSYPYTTLSAYTHCKSADGYITK
jgi:hypothetical protein